MIPATPVIPATLEVVDMVDMVFKNATLSRMIAFDSPDSYHSQQYYQLFPMIAPICNNFS